MNASEIIRARQKVWAFNAGIQLVGSQYERGEHLRTLNTSDNLFEPLSADAIESFQAADGGELVGNQASPPKMNALHSSSALAVNIFQYWQTMNDVPSIASACGLCREGNPSPQKTRFEVKFKILATASKHPNIDVVIENSASSPYKVFAIEAKFTEPYSTRLHGGMKDDYFGDAVDWNSLPKLYALARSLNPDDNVFKYLHAAQLIKHILGLKKAHGSGCFRLLYLWYDAFGSEGAEHRSEIDRFMEIAKQDGVLFHSLSYQELLITLFNRYSSEAKHRNYLSYVCNRYL